MTCSLSRAPHGGRCVAPGRCRHGSRARHQCERVAATEVCCVCVAGMSAAVVGAPAPLRSHFWVPVVCVVLWTVVAPPCRETEGRRAVSLTARAVPVRSCRGQEQREVSCAGPFCELLRVTAPSGACLLSEPWPCPLTGSGNTMDLVVGDRERVHGKRGSTQSPETKSTCVPCS